VKLVAGKENSEGGLGRCFSDRRREKRMGPVLTRCDTVGGVGGQPVTVIAEARHRPRSGGRGQRAARLQNRGRGQTAFKFKSI
jgi:hypothetical protein